MLCQKTLTHTTAGCSFSQQGAASYKGRLQRLEMFSQVLSAGTHYTHKHQNQRQHESNSAFRCAGQTSRSRYRLNEVCLGTSPSHAALCAATPLKNTGRLWFLPNPLGKWQVRHLYARLRVICMVCEVFDILRGIFAWVRRDLGLTGFIRLRRAGGGIRVQGLRVKGARF